MLVVKIYQKTLLFSTTELNLKTWTTIEGLSLKKVGILKEHPDLEGLSNAEMRRIAIERFKEHVKKMKTDNEIKDYVVSELEKHGYRLKMIHREGFRPEKIK